MNEMERMFLGCNDSVHSSYQKRNPISLTHTIDVHNMREPCTDTHHNSIFTDATFRAQRALHAMWIHQIVSHETHNSPYKRLFAVIRITYSSIVWLGMIHLRYVCNRVVDFWIFSRILVELEIYSAKKYMHTI